MPPKAASAGVGASAVPKVPLERILQISVMQHTARMTFDFVRSVVPEVVPFESAWIQDEVTGASLVGVGPLALHSVLRASFPEMNAALRSKIFACFRNRIVEEKDKGKNGDAFIPSDIANLWFMLPEAPAPITLFPNQHDKREVRIGVSSHAYFQSPAPRVSLMSPMTPSQNALFERRSDGASQNQQRAGAVFNSQSGGASADGRSDGAAAGGRGDGASALGQRDGALPNSQSDGALHSQTQSSIDSQFAQSRDLFAAQGLSINVLVKPPWIRRAELRVADIQDPKMPIGFDRVNIHDKIEKAVADRLAKGNIGLQAAHHSKVNWPVWNIFNRAGFLACRLAYYECVLASLTTAVFRDFKDCLTGVARNGACLTFHMTDNDFSQLPDRDFMNDCQIFFGPRNSDSALSTLQEIRFPDHRDKVHSQSLFLQKFDTVSHEFLLAVNDIVSCHEFWPQVDSSSSFVSSFPVKTIMDQWYKVFPRQGFGTPSSVQIKQCKDFFDINKKMCFRDVVRTLRGKFAEMDLKVEDKQCNYTTSPIESLTAAGSVSTPRHQSLVAANVSAPGAKRNRDTPLSGRRPDQAPSGRQQSSGISKKPTHGRDRNEFQKNKQAVPGHLRGKACGSPNNHHGLGCSRDTCPAFGTEHAKPPGYVWKSSTEEPAVRPPNEWFKARLLANPKIQQNWDRARDQKRTQVAAIAVDASEDDDDDFDCDDDERKDDSSAKSDGDNDSVNLSEYVASELAAICASLNNVANPFVDVAAMQLASHPLENFGYMPQFFGVARFAQNDEFRSQCLMDPGAAINVISPMLANRSAVERVLQNVSIFTGKRKTASVNEMVRVLFELMRLDGSYTKHSEWFAVSDMGYNLLLGRKFCKENGFTQFDSMLTSFEDFARDADNVVHVAAIDLSFAPTTASFIRVQAPDGEARNKRKPKVVPLVHDPAATVNLISGAMLKAIRNTIAMLNVIEYHKDADGNSNLLLEFIMATSPKSSPKQQAWFRIDKTLKQGCIITTKFALATGMLPSHLPLMSSNAAPLNSQDFSIRQPHIADGATNEFVANAAIPIARDYGPGQRVINRRGHAKADAENTERFVSRHPISNYAIKRPAEPPLRPRERDHPNFHHFKIMRARANVAALEREAVRVSCVHGRNGLRNTLAQLNDADITSVESCLDSFIQEQASAAEAAAMHPEVANLVDSHSANMPRFVPGVYVEIIGAERQPSFNGHRARLHKVHPSAESTEDALWEIRVLGKNQGLWLCRQSRLRILAPLEQQRSRPHPASAAFDDVGIDAGGQPDVDTKLLAHRQFGSEYSAALTARIEALKLKFPHVFTTDVSEPCTFEPMRIKLKPNAVLPGKARFYRNTPKMREEVRRQIQEQLDWGAVRRCVTPHVSDVLLVKRPHMPGKFRFVVSYVKLNEAIEDEQLIMPDARTQHERLAGKKIFGAFDFSSYYRQIRLHEDSQYLTGFASDEGTFCYCTVPMGIKTACAYAQRVLQEALQNDPVIGQLNIKNYFDDLPFAADTEDEFMFIFEALLNFCSEHKLKVNPEKSVFGVKSITHVGFVVSEQGVAIDPERYRDLSELTAPKSIKKVQSVLGILNYVRNFVPNFSDKARFLTDKLVAVPASAASTTPAKRPRPKRAASVDVSVAGLGAAVMNAARAPKVKSVPVFTWTDEDSRLFEELKTAVLQCPMLEMLDYSKPIFIRCDASRFGAGAVLFQYDDRGFEHVVCYASRKFLPAERNWSTFAQEASTVVWSLERFAEFTQGYHVVVECDHRNISFVKKSSMPQIARWRLRLQDMDFTVRYLAGPNNLCSDGLSRQHVDDDDVGVDLSDVIPECALAEATEDQRKALSDIAEIAAIAVQCAPAAARANKGRPAPRFDSPAPSALSSADESAVFAEQYAIDSDDSDNESSDSDVESEPLFGANGEVLDEAGQPLADVNPQPIHLQLPVIDASAEFLAVHNNLIGHGGAYVTLQRALKNGREWASKSQMLADIDNFIKSCPCCQKMRKRSSNCLVDRHVISGSPFSELSIDLLKLPNADAYGMKYVVVVVDNFSRWTSLVAVRNKSAVEATRALLHVIGSFGAPLSLRSDGGAEFVNGVINGITRLLGISHHVVLPYTPTANGIVERANRAILERLREMVSNDKIVKHPEHVWSDLLPLVQRCINSSFHSALGTSPARILFGDNIDLDRCLLSSMPASKTVDVQTYVGALSYNQRVILEAADRYQQRVCNKVIEKARAKQRRQGENGVLRDAEPKVFEEGAWVLVKPQESYPLNKLAPRWLGPFRVARFVADSEVVVVMDTVSNKHRRFLKRQLEAFNVGMVADVEGLTKIAESDNFEFPVDAIIGHALIGSNGVGADPTQLPPDFRRQTRHKRSFQFLIKWTNYEEPTWVAYNTASRLVQFPGYIVHYPLLNMS